MAQTQAQSLLPFAAEDLLDPAQAAQAELSRLAAEAVQDIQHYSRDWTTIDRVRRGLIRKLEP